MHFESTREHLFPRQAGNVFSKKRVLVYVIAITTFIAAFAAMLPIQQSKAVIGGPVQSKAPSWVAFLARYQDGKIGYCSGVLVSKNLLLSARHCQSDYAPNRAVIGSADLNKSGGTHANIKAFEGYTGEDDLAVYQLSSPIDNRYITLSDLDIHLNPRQVTLYGYGTNSEMYGPDPTNDFRLRSVSGISVACDNTGDLTEWQFCLTSQSAGQAPCGGDSGAPVVTEAGKLGAIYMGFLAQEPRCVDSLWLAVSVTPEPVRKWITDMIEKYRVHEDL